MSKIKYTFTFEHDNERKFRDILSRLGEDEYNIIQDVQILDKENPRYSDKEAIIEMDPECCLMFRMGMKNLKIRRERSEEELAEEKEINDRHTIRINVQVSMGDPGTSS